MRWSTLVIEESARQNSVYLIQPAALRSVSVWDRIYWGERKTEIEAETEKERARDGERGKETEREKKEGERISDQIYIHVVRYDLFAGSKFIIVVSHDYFLWKVKQFLIFTWDFQRKLRLTYDRKVDCIADHIKTCTETYFKDSSCISGFIESLFYPWYYDMWLDAFLLRCPSIPRGKVVVECCPPEIWDVNKRILKIDIILLWIGLFFFLTLLNL